MNDHSALTQETAARNIHAAVSHNDWPTLLNLLRCGHSIDARDPEGDSPLYVACRLERLEAVRKLIQFGANVEAANDAGHTPLMAAVASENPEIAQLLLKARANVKALTPANGQTALHWALAHPPKDPEKVATIVHLLLEAGAEVNQKSRDGITPLMHAAWFGLQRATVVLLARGADPNIGDNRGRKALELARERGHLAICEIVEAVLAEQKNKKKEGILKKFGRWWQGE